MYTRLSGNKLKTIFCLLILGVMLVLAGCPGYSDWAYDDLPGDYLIVRVNSKHIVFEKGTFEFSDRVINRQIIAFCYDARYICLKRVPVEGVDDTRFDPEKLDTSNPEFYLIDSVTEHVYGPWTEEAFYKQVDHWGLTGLCEWIPTNPRPEGAH